MVALAHATAGSYAPLPVAVGQASYRWVMGPGDLPVLRRTEGKPARWRGKLSAPLLPAKDDHKRPARGRQGRGVQLTERALEFRACFASLLGAKLPPITERSTSTRFKRAEHWLSTIRAPLIREGRWRLHLLVYVPKQAKTNLGAGEPFMDSDACLMPVRDALEWARVLDDDMRIREDHTRTEYRAGEPGLDILLRRLP